MIVGVDLGGTKITAALVSSQGKIKHEITIPAEAHLGKEKVIQNILKAVQVVSHRTKIEKIGIGVPGPVFYNKGIVVEPPNLPGWKRVNLKKILEKEFKLPVYLDNDANCAALAEARFGAGRQAKNFIYLTVSTGIGGGIIIERELYRGRDGSAGEFGHITLDPSGPQCGCGKFGCLEALASGSAIRKKSGMDPIAVELAARQGDKKALKVIEETAHYLALGIANLVNIFNPEVVIIGGGLSNIRELLFNPLREEFKKYVLTLPGQAVKIVRAKLGVKAGVLGAAALCQS